MTASILTDETTNRAMLGGLGKRRQYTDTGVAINYNPFIVTFGNKFRLPVG